MQLLDTRKKKIKYLNKLLIGNASVLDLTEPITTMVFIHDDKVFAYTTRQGTQLFECSTNKNEFQLKNFVNNKKILNNGIR